MSDAMVSTQLLCKQCSAPLSVELGAKFVTCEFCNPVNFVDKSQAVLHYTVTPTLDEQGAAAALRRWMAGNQTVKGLDQAAHIESQTYQLFPLWQVRTVHGQEEKVIFKPAAALSIVGLSKLSVPAADLVPYNDALDGVAVKPTVPVTAVHSWLANNEGIPTGTIEELSLVHTPIYQFKYTYKEQSYTALVDAAAGQVFTAIYPEKFELPYVSIGGFGCLAYFLAALIPIITLAVTNSNIGLWLGIVIYLGVAIALAIPIFMVAASISRRY